jgi:hypothetical protein
MTQMYSQKRERMLKLNLMQSLPMRKKLKLKE